MAILPNTDPPNNLTTSNKALRPLAHPRRVEARIEAVPRVRSLVLLDHRAVGPHRDRVVDRRPAALENRGRGGELVPQELEALVQSGATAPTLDQRREGAGHRADEVARPCRNE